MYLFEGYSIDSELRELRRDGALVAIEPQVFDLLHYLIRNRERVVSKSDMIAAVWNGRIVSESALTSRLTAVRHAVGDSGEEQRLIRTMPRKGLRFVGEVREQPPSANVTRPAAALPIGDKPSIAVLPFNNMSGDAEQEYFSDGITEDIITDLSQVSALFVVARHTAFTLKGKAISAQQAARELGVNYILEGSVRKAEHRVRISAQLIDGLTGGHIWAKRYDRDLGDIFALQDEISRSIVDALSLELLPTELATSVGRTTDNAEAYQYYLIGRWLLMFVGDKRAFRVARQMFAKAVEIDPEYARAHAGIATSDCFLMLTSDPTISFEGIFASSRRALELAPELAEAHAAKGVALDTSGRFEEATVEFEEAIKLDPDSFDAHFFYGRTSLSRTLHEQAIRLFERAAELQPKDFRSLCFAAMEYVKLQRHKEARAATQRCLERVETEIKARPDNAQALCFGAWALACTGQKARAEALIAQAAVIDPDDCFMQYNIACVYSMLGRIDAAIDHLDNTLARTTASSARWYVEWMKQDTDFDPLRMDPRFQTLLTRLESQASQQTQ